jgi:crotonobetainyl-CoA:carnitine CoA-transferase CaiB-like acyl-CoA transferase
MSDFGARVIKIEPPGIGDSYRQLMKVPGIPPEHRRLFLDARQPQQGKPRARSEARRTRGPCSKR